ncbi:hypothetical protein [Salinimicrobium marinum]|uniref:hypothetical protein n=1 Tax=Salinimicrobium marinum TaxID=680283 RepID=UPI00167AE7C7|nr:hypothetical protein [Salinimicrobium marinum]
MRNSVKYLIVIIILNISIQVQGQELEGKWIISGNSSFEGFPGIHLMEIDEDSLSHYNFNEYFSKTSLTVEGNKFKVDTLTFATFNFKSADRLTISSKRLEKPVDYIRLTPSSTSLTKEEIRKTEYNLNRGGETFVIDFKKHPESKIVHSYLEKIDDTYFLVIYRYGKKVTAVPIQEVTEDGLSLYGFPGVSEPIFAEAIRE